jgi:hypothetical protein
MYTLAGGVLFQPTVDPPCRRDAPLERSRMDPVVVEP